jgi:hypothetical protein
MTVTEMGRPTTEIQVDALPGGAPIVNDAALSLARDAMLRLVERRYPDYKD